MSERSTFSPFWHRVRGLRPRLRPHVQITRQHYRARRWHVVHDPSSNHFFRLNPVAHEFVGMLDGRRSVEDVWQHALTKHADDALTQNEVIQLLSQLFSSNLLSADIPPETEQLLRRGKERLAGKAKQQAIGLMYFKVRLFNPDAILAWLEPLFRPLISRAGFILWSVWVLAAFFFAILPNWDRLVSGVDSAIAPSNWGFMIATFVVIKLIHEAGHGLICKRFGGQVPEFGAMMLVLVPAPYVDASAAWGFRSKWQRMAVGAGGMIFELAVAAGAAWVWAGTSGGMLHTLAYNAIFSASVSTVLFNANPLMKFDGYYILSDLLEIPNLMPRSNQMLKFLAQRHLYRVKTATPPTSSPSEALILIAYGLASMIYRVFLFISITLYVLGQMFVIGLFLAVWTSAMWFILPVGAFVHWLATSPQLAEFRPRAIGVSLLLVAGVVLAIGVVPFQDRRRADGVVESTASTGVYAGVDGFVSQIDVRAGERVVKGQRLGTLESDTVLAELVTARAQLAEAESKGLAATSENPTAAQVARAYVDALRRQIELLEKKKAALVVTAPHDGVVVGGDPRTLLGAYVQEGQELCQIVDDQSLRITAVLSQTQANWIRAENFDVEARLLSAVEEVIPAKKDRVIDVATRELPHEALGFGGGGDIEIDSQDRTGRVAKSAVYEGHFFAVQPDGVARPGLISSRAGRPGERAVLRFTLDRKPLVSQWWLRLQQTLQGRAKV